MKLHKDYKQYTGRYSYDVPKKLLGKADKTPISVYLRGKDAPENMALGVIDWRDIVGWRDYE